MLYGAIRTSLPFAHAEFTETSLEGQVIFLAGKLCSFKSLKNRQICFNAGGGTHRDRKLLICKRVLGTDGLDDTWNQDFTLT